MPSPDLVTTAKRMIREHPDLFEALLEYERTKKLPKLTRKVRVNITLDRDLYREFLRVRTARGLKLSPLLEAKLRDALRNDPTAAARAPQRKAPR